MLSQNEAEQDVYNVACGDQTTLKGIIKLLEKISKKSIVAQYSEERKGDIKHSKANIDKIKNKLGVKTSINFVSGIEIVYEWYNNSGNLL